MLDGDTDTRDSENIVGNEGKNQKISMFLKDGPFVRKGFLVRGYSRTDLPPCKDIAILTREIPIEISLQLSKGSILLQRGHCLNSSEEH